MHREQQKKLAKYQKINRAKSTPAEDKVRQQLEDAGIYHIPEKGFFNGDYFYLVDFYLPKPLKTVIEVDGGYHVTREWRDQIRDQYLTEVRGFKVIRLSNDTVLDPTFSILDYVQRMKGVNEGR